MHFSKGDYKFGRRGHPAAGTHNQVSSMCVPASCRLNHKAIEPLSKMR